MTDVYISVQAVHPQWDAVERELAIELPKAVRAKAVMVLRRGGKAILEDIRENVNLPSDAPRGWGHADNVRKIHEQANYRNSWQSIVLFPLSTHPELVISTGKPQARRLEYGFVGTDSRGRRYNQPPYPHAGKAFDKHIVGITAEMTALLGL